VRANASASCSAFVCDSSLENLTACAWGDV
jgi:hypothetical protein